MAYRVREATAADDVEIGELLVLAFDEQYARKMPEVVISEGRRASLRAVAAKRAVAKVWVCVAGEGRVVGTVALWPPGAQGSEAWVAGACDLRHLAVASGHRGGAVSTLLLDTAEAWARAHGTGVCLHVRRGAKGVRALYAARGYADAPEGDLDQRPDVYLEAMRKTF